MASSSSSLPRSSRAVIIPATNAHILELLEQGLREQDVNELTAFSLEPGPCLVDSFNASQPQCFTILADGVPCAMFGVAPGEYEGWGVPWMLGTDLCLTIARDLIVQGMYWIDHLNRMYPFLQNFVSADNTVAVGWLKRMGFEFPDSVEVNNHTFHRFTRGELQE